MIFSRSRSCFLLSVLLCSGILLTRHLLKPPQGSWHPYHGKVASEHIENNQTVANAGATFIFVCVQKDSRSWIDEELQFIPPENRVIYIADDHTAPFHPPRNVAREATSYLTYIVDNYDRLPEIMVFLHCHSDTWRHNNRRFDVRTAPMLSSLRLAPVRQAGFVNLLCDRDLPYLPGCKPNRRHKLHLLSSIDFSDLDPSTTHRSITQGLADTLRAMDPMRPLPSEIGVPNGAQFAVTKQAVLSAPREYYLRLQARLLALGSDPRANHFAGHIMEYLWHVIFLGPDHGVLCPSEDECYCELYGDCRS